VLRLQTRRFFCGNNGCERKIFAEQVSGLTVRHGRRSVQLRDVLRRIAFTLGGRPGARLSEGLASAVSRMTLLRLIRALPEEEIGPLRVIGVDQWAFRKGRTYGTILVDMATRRPVDLLPEATSDALAAWLERYPGIEVICRDRAGYFAAGARRGAPEAIQVADRWHLLANLSNAVERVLSRNKGQPAGEARRSRPDTAHARARTTQRRAGPADCRKTATDHADDRPGAGPSARSLGNSISTAKLSVVTPAAPSTIS
jgi:transposase